MVTWNDRWMAVSALVQFTSLLTVVNGVAILHVTPHVFRSPAQCDRILPCDYKFVYCFSPVRSSTCHYYKHLTGKYGSSPVWLAERIVIPITEWMGGFNFRMEAIDDDIFTKDDLITELSSDMYLIPAKNSTGELITVTSSRGSLSLSAYIECKENYYGSTCDTWCAEEQPRYTCHPDTGKRICMNGWSGEWCDMAQLPSTSSLSGESTSTKNRFAGENFGQDAEWIVQRNLEPGKLSSGEPVGEGTNSTLLAIVISVLSVALILAALVVLWMYRRLQNLRSEETKESVIFQHEPSSNDYTPAPTLKTKTLQVKLSGCEIIDSDYDGESGIYEEISALRDSPGYVRAWDSVSGKPTNNPSDV